MPELLQAVQQSLDIYILSLAKEQIQVTYEQIKAQTIYSVSRALNAPSQSTSMFSRPESHFEPFFYFFREGKGRLDAQLP